MAHYCDLMKFVKLFKLKKSLKTLSTLQLTNKKCLKKDKTKKIVKISFKSQDKNRQNQINLDIDQELLS